jgi:hypothetical protein
MQAKRAVLETDGQGRLKSVPTLPPDARIEATFLVLDPAANGTPRTPPPELAGLKIVGDIMAPVIAEDDWTFMK